MKKQIKYGVIMSYISIFVVILIKLWYTPWLKNQVGIESFGLYSLVTSLITMILIDFGIGESVTRFISKYRAEKNDEQISNTIGLAFKAYIILDIILCIILIIVYFYLDSIYIGLSLSELSNLKTMYLLIILINAITFPFTILNGILNSYERFLFFKSSMMAQNILNIILVVLFLNYENNIIMLIYANCITTLLILIIKIIYIKIKIKIKVNFKSNDYWLLKQIFTFTGWVLVITLSQQAINNLAPTILGIFSNTTDIAIFSASTAISGYFVLIAISINGLYIPEISRCVAIGDEEKIENHIMKVGRYQTILLVLILVGFYLIGKDFMTIWMGEEFYLSYYCALFLMLSLLFEHSQQLCETTLLVKNYNKMRAIGILIITIAGLLLACIMTYFFGVIGTSVALCITGFFKVIYLNYIYVTILKLNLKKFYYQCYIKIVPSVVITLILSLFINSIITYNNAYINLIVSTIIIIIIYIFSIYFSYLNKSEKNYLIKLVKK